MMTLIVLALGFGVALTAYELTRTRDDYARAIRSAHAAHQAADAHLSNAHAAVVTAIDTAVDHVAVADAANKEAARKTAEAAKNAQDEAQRQEVAQSAAKVLAREKEIAAKLDSFGIGQCGVRTYKRVTEQVKDKLLAKLSAEGMSVTGNNPWSIDTRKYGVRLRAVWDFRVSELKLIVTTGKGTEVIPYVKDVTCQDIWDKIEPKLREVIGS